MSTDKKFDMNEFLKKFDDNFWAKYSNKRIELLKKSIEHWEENLEELILNYLSNDSLITDIEIYSEYCPLCKKYTLNNICEGCPIAEAGYVECRNSPWEKVEEWYSHIQFWGLRKDYEKGYQEGYTAISNQIEFLNSILEKLENETADQNNSLKDN